MALPESRPIEGPLLEIVAAYLNEVPVIVLRNSSELASRLSDFLISPMDLHLDTRRVAELLTHAQQTGL